MSKVVGLDGKTVNTELSRLQIDLLDVVDDIRRDIISGELTWLVLLGGSDNDTWKASWVTTKDFYGKLGVLERIKHRMLLEAHVS